jgi:hypothetical protein
MTSKEVKSPVEKAAWEKTSKLPLITRTYMEREGVSKTMAIHFINRWLQKGWIVEFERRGHQRFYVTPERRDKALQGSKGAKTAEDAMWIVMLRARTFTLTDLTAVASVGDLNVTIHQARQYVKDLMAGGYVVVRQAAVPRKSPAVYHVINRTGERAPKPMRLRGLYDPNAGTFEAFLHGGVE